MDRGLIDEGARLLRAVSDSAVAALYSASRRRDPAFAAQDNANRDAFSADVQACRAWYFASQLRLDAFTTDLVWPYILDLNYLDAVFGDPSAYGDRLDIDVTLKVGHLSGKREGIMMWLAVARGSLSDNTKVAAA
jgi:hypothetical protein